MACVLPFRPWLSPVLRVFGSRTAWNQSTDSSLILSCTSVPPQRLSPKLVAFLKKLGRPCLLRKAPRFSPRPFSMSKPDSPFSHRACARRLKGIATPFKSPVLRVWLPSRRRQPSSPRERFFSSPHSWASPSRAFLRSWGPRMISHACSALTLFRQTLRLGTDASAVSAHQTSRASSSRSIFLKPGGATALLGFCTFRAFLRRILREAPSFSLPLSFFPYPPPKMPITGTSGDSFPRLSVSLLSKGARPLGVYDRLSSAAPLEQEPTTAYFFGSGPRKPYNARGLLLCGRSHPA
jgi:hypothetical protein